MTSTSTPARETSAVATRLAAKYLDEALHAAADRISSPAQHTQDTQHTQQTQIAPPRGIGNHAKNRGGAVSVDMPEQKVRSVSTVSEIDDPAALVVSSVRYLNQGFTCKKHPRKGRAKSRYFFLAEDSRGSMRLYWNNNTTAGRVKDDSRSIEFSTITQVRKGLMTQRIRRRASNKIEDNCVSLCGSDLTRESLDLQFETKAARDFFVLATLLVLVDHHSSSSSADGGAANVEYVNGARTLLQLSSGDAVRDSVSFDHPDGEDFKTKMDLFGPAADARDTQSSAF